MSETVMHSHHPELIATHYLHGVVDVPVRSELGLDVHVTK